MTYSFIERQITQMQNLTDLYSQGNLSLNRYILQMEGVLALDGMEKVKRNISRYVEELEEINAYLLDDGKLTEIIDAEIRNFVASIKQALVSELNAV